MITTTRPMDRLLNTGLIQMPLQKSKMSLELIELTMDPSCLML